MRSDFDELKRFAIADILSVSGRQKTTETVDMHINTIIDIAFLKGQQESQSKVDALTLQVAEMKSRLNDAYTDGQSAMYTARQSKIDELTKQRDSFIKAYEIEMDESVELQRRNQMLNDNIKEQGQKLAYQNEVIETQAEKLLGLRDEKAELQKRVDAALKLIPSLKAENDLWGCDQVDRQIELLEQALKGEHA